MTALANGTKVTIIEGTTILVDSGETHESGPLAGFRKFDRSEIGRPYHRTAETEFTVRWVGCSHATMNGGGRDYGLLDGNGVECQVRTTLARPESATFILQ
jgi:hypothetical protein